MSWARAVKEWNSGQIFRDDMYGIPKKGGDYYDDVKEIMDRSKHKKDVAKMMGKEEQEAVTKIESEEKSTPRVEKKEMVPVDFDELKVGDAFQTYPSEGGEGEETDYNVFMIDKIIPDRNYPYKLKYITVTVDKEGNKTYSPIQKDRYGYKIASDRIVWKNPIRKYQQDAEITTTSKAMKEILNQMITGKLRV